MSKLGRNEPCHCGSGKKYKRCCGGNASASTAPFHLSPEIQHRLNLEIGRHEAKEHARRLMQGLGRPIISFEAHGHRLVAVRNRIYWSKNWRTFRHCSADSEIAIDRADDRFYTTGPNLLLLRGAH